MKRAGAFLKTTVAGGFCVLLPLVAVLYVLKKLVEISRSAAAPIREVLPGVLAAQPVFPLALGIILIVAACFFAGLLLRSEASKTGGKAVEEKLLFPFPGYRTIKGLALGLVGSS